MDKNVRVRFAPSPSGHMHIGNARTALYNWLFARKHKGQFILRIEDTDAQRSTEESISGILDSLKWLGLDWDEGPEKGGDFGPYFQSQKLDIYNKYIDKLVNEGKAYPCFCSTEELDSIKKEAQKNKQQYRYGRKCLSLSPEQAIQYKKDNKPYVIRLKKPEDKPIIFNDIIKGPINIHSETIDDFIIRRSDGYPIYNFAVTIDDISMKITHVFRGDDHISNTPKQILIYEALGSDITQFGHLPMILGEDKSRLSKRHGVTSVQEFKEKGILPEAMLNYLARLGWGFDDSQEIFPAQELIEKFSIEKVSGNPAIFNYQKLEWINSIYLQKMDIDKKTELVIPFLIKRGFINEDFSKNNFEYLKQIILLIGERFKTFDDIPFYSDYFFMDKNEFAQDVIEKLFKKFDLKEPYQKIINSLESVSKWEKDELQKCLEDLAAQLTLKKKDYYQAIRAALTGRVISPDLLGIIILMGKEKTIKKLKQALEFLAEMK